MDEDEYDYYLKTIDLIDPLVRTDIIDYVLKFEQLRDDDGLRVPGCYRRKPTRIPFEEY